MNTNESSNLAARVVNKAVEVGEAMFDAATVITFIDSKRFRAAVTACAKHMNGNDELAEDILLSHARVWPVDYKSMIPEERRLGLIRVILGEMEGKQ